jgi:thioredoxin reductase (NADPH)
MGCLAAATAAGSPLGIHAFGSGMADAAREKVVILGSGPAGATAAIYAARAMLNPVMIGGLQPGGQLTITTDVENYPGFAAAVQGPWLMEQMTAQAEHVGARIVQDMIASVDLAHRPFVLNSDSGAPYLAETLIIATGAQAKWLGLESEEAFKGFGVSACATCDGFFFRGKQVAVVGGGNTAAEEALFLTNFAEHVTLIHRRSVLRADMTNQLRLASNAKITIRYDTVVDEIVGGTNPRAVNAVRLRSLEDGATETLAVEGLFVAIGHTPATEVFRGQIDMDGDGYIRTEPDSTRTSVPGVFAAGDVKDKVFRQAVTAAGMGCMAALEAERFLAGAH